MKQTEAMKIMGRNDPCWCGSGQKYKKCHLGDDQRTGKGAPASTAAGSTPRPTSRPAARPMGSPVQPSRSRNLIKTQVQIEGIRKAGVLTRETLDMLEGKIVPGVTTEQINTWVHQFTLDHGAVPAPLNYKGFPKSVCTSVNDVVCHGIPEDRVLKDGDIINVDVTPILNGFYADSSRMYLMGEVDGKTKALVEATNKALHLGIEQVKPGGRVGDIGHAIQTYAEAKGYSVVRDFVGHGTGINFHEDPQVPHFGRPGKGPAMLPGMVFTIEPMINMGDWRVKVLEDGWTAITADGSLSAQFEHTLLVTPDGVEILTA